MKIAFLDRDGTIVKDYPDEDWKHKVVPEVLNGAIEGMLLLNQLGFEIIIVTNQYIINDGIITLDEYNEFTNHLKAIFDLNGIKVLDIFYCPHSESEQCNCKKPRTGMIRMAIEKYPFIELDKSLMIGDSLSDEAFARSMSLKFFMIDSNAEMNEDKYHSIKDVIIKNIGTGHEHVEKCHNEVNL